MSNEFNQFLRKYIDQYRIFMGANNYEVDIASVTDQTKEIEGVDSIASMSGEWYTMLVEKQPKNFIFYDINPVMLIHYNFMWKLISISPSRREFLENMFCRKIDDNFKFQSNDDVIAYLGQKPNKSMYNRVLGLLSSNRLAHLYYSTFVKDNVILAPKGKIILYPTYIYRTDADKFLLDRRLRTTPSGKGIDKFFTTFYYDYISPFDTDENYLKLYNNVIRIEKPRFILFNLNEFWRDSDNILPYVDGNLLLYISDMDNEHAPYLKSREYLFDDIRSSFESSKVSVLSMISGITTITRDDITYSKKFSTKKRVSRVQCSYNKQIVYDPYTISIIKELNH